MLQKLKFITVTLLALLFFGKIFFLITTFNHGIDISDEGMHLLMYKYPKEYSVTIHNYHYMVTTFLPQSLVTVFNLRLMWLLADLAGWLILFTGCISFLRNIGISISKASIFLLLLTGSNAIALSIHDRIIAYNVLSNFFLNISSGILLFAVGRKDWTWANRLLVGGAFSFVALELFIKPTASLGIAAFEFIICIIFFKKRILEIIFCSIVGIMISLTFMLIVVLPSFKIWVSNYFEGVKLAHISGYGSTTMLIHLYIIPTMFYCVLILLANIPIIRLLNWVTTKKNLTDNTFILLSIISHWVSCAVFLFLLQIVSTKTFNFEILKETSSTFHSAILLIPNSLISQFLTSRIRFAEFNPPPFKWNVFAICAFLTALPYFIIFGSFSSIDVSLYGHLLPLLVLLFIIPYLFAADGIKTKLIAYYIYFITILCTYFFIRHYIFYPTRMLQPLTEQKVNVGTNETILTDSASAAFIRNLKQKVNAAGNFTSATQIGLQPGLLYFLGMKQPGNNFYLSVSIVDDPDSTFKPIEDMNAAYNDFFYKKFAREIAQGPVLINAGVTPQDIKAINKRMAEIDCELMLLDSVYNPYIEQELKYNPAVGNPYTYVYLPKKSQPDL